eukprot:EG_transcript_2630
MHTFTHTCTHAHSLSLVPLIHAQQHTYVCVHARTHPHGTHCTFCPSVYQSNCPDLIQQLDSFFTALKLTPHTFAFVTELDGSLVASSPEGLSTALPALPTESGALKVRVAAQSAGDGRIAEAATWLVQHFGSFYAVPANDSDFVVSLEGQSHYLFTGHVQDRYGLHWVIVIGLPRSDVLHNLDAATVGAILSISATLLMSMACLGAVAGVVRQHLRRCARRIALMGTMDLERANQLEGALILEEVQLVLLSLRDTICNLQQFRAFLPPTVLDKVRQAEPVRGEAHGGPAGPPPPRWRSHESHASITEPPGPPPHDTGGVLPDDVLPATPVLRDGAVASSSGSYSRSLVHAALERRMGRVAVTLVALQLPGLHGTHPAACTPVDFMLWYEACLSTALAIVQTCHGDFYRLSGDQLLFSWGAVRQVATRCGNACQAALHLSQQLQMLDAQAAHGVQYAPRLSVVAGSVLCGVMGTTTARDLYLIGPLVRQARSVAWSLATKEKSSPCMRCWARTQTQSSGCTGRRPPRAGQSSPWPWTPWGAAQWRRPTPQVVSVCWVRNLILFYIIISNFLWQFFFQVFGARFKAQGIK